MIYFPEYCREIHGKFFTPFVDCGKWGVSVRGRDIQREKEVEVEVMNSEPTIEYVGQLCEIPEEDILMLKLTYSY